MLAAKTDLAGIERCTISDNGHAVVNYLEFHNGMRTLGTLGEHFHGKVRETIVAFLERSTYPVFEELCFDCFYISDRAMLQRPATYQSNVCSFSVKVGPDEVIPDELLEALRHGLFAPSKLKMLFSCPPNQQATAVENLCDAVGSTDCQLHELSVHLKGGPLSSTGLEGHFIEMLRGNASLQTLSILDENGDVLPFPATKLLNVATQHPRLRKLAFVPPCVDPPTIGQAGQFHLWYRANLSHKIVFKDVALPGSDLSENTNAVTYAANGRTPLSFVDLGFCNKLAMKGSAPICLSRLWPTI